MVKVSFGTSPQSNEEVVVKPSTSPDTMPALSPSPDLAAPFTDPGPSVSQPMASSINTASLFQDLSLAGEAAHTSHTDLSLLGHPRNNVDARSPTGSTSVKFEIPTSPRDEPGGKRDASPRAAFKQSGRKATPHPLAKPKEDL